LRLRGYGYALGLINENQWQRLVEKQEAISLETARLEKIHKQINGKGHSLAQILRRPENSYQSILEHYPEDLRDHGPETNFQIELELKYSGYIDRQNQEIARLSHVERIQIPQHFDFRGIKGLRNEAKDKLSHAGPLNLGQASRISGVSPADISVL